MVDNGQLRNTRQVADYKIGLGMEYACDVSTIV